MFLLITDNVYYYVNLVRHLYAYRGHTVQVKAARVDAQQYVISA